MEARLRFTQTWGGVVFVDGGNVFDEQLPQFDQGMRWAIGFGARYTTSLAPIRLDIAFPVNGQPGIGDAFQIYVSLAQAF
jgi:translocation and assembly module TamA